MGHDAELEQLRAEISCALLLERISPSWRLDRRESTQRCLKYRRGPGEVLLVTHGGRGWWDPGSVAKGDVFGLVQHLEPGLNFGQVRQALRPLVGQIPSYSADERPFGRGHAGVPVAVRWQRRWVPAPGSSCWRYLTEQRGLPAPVVLAAIRAGVLREGPRASAWFAHHDHHGALSGIEMRGPDYRGFSSGGRKSLFRLRGGMETAWRLAVTEAPIDAMSLATIERMRVDTLYLATAGGMGPGTILALEQQLRALAGRSDAVLMAATDADPAGENYAMRLAEMAAAAGICCERLRPFGGVKDWNDSIKKQQG
jgi:Toprim-like/Protein of unknown function (DUF3991)